VRLKIIIFLLAASSLVAIKPSSANNIDFQKTIDSYNLIGLSTAQKDGWDGTGQTIVVIDDGNRIDHPYLSGVFVDGYCTSRNVCGSDYLKPGIKSGGAHKGNGFHGAMVSGIIAGQVNSSAPGGIAPKAKIISIDNTDGGSEGLIAAMEWVLTIRKKYNVVAVSGSIGAPNSSGLRGGEGDCSLDPTLSVKIKELVNAGIVMIFAAGNGGSVSKLDFPACLPEVVSVGALTSKGSIADYSNISKSLTVLAPAEILSSNGDGGYFIGGGTSSATPIVAGAVALLKQAKPDATPQEIKSALQSTRSRISDVLWANLPILNLPRAIEAIQTGKFELQPITPIGNVTQSPAPTVTLTPTPAPTVTVTATPQPTPAKTIILKQITCLKGKLIKKITAVNPVCPAGYKKK
jgi:subtilisin family serine protease